jgi:hypothetical protein
MASTTTLATETSTLTRSDVEWGTQGEKPCTCGRDGCLVCEVEGLAGEGKPFFTYRVEDPAEVN